MSDEAIMENYGNIQDLYSKLLILTERIIKLETIIVELANTEEELDDTDKFLINAEHLCNDEDEEEHYSIEELAEIALEQRANEDRGEDR